MSIKGKKSSAQILPFIYAAYTNHWTNLRRAETKRRKEFNLEAWEIQEKKKDLQNQPQAINKMAIGTHISIITLNVNRLNTPTKRHRLATATAKSFQSCPTLCDPIDGSPPGSAVPGILQARMVAG